MEITMQSVKEATEKLQEENCQKLRRKQHKQKSLFLCHQHYYHLRQLLSNHFERRKIGLASRNQHNNMKKLLSSQEEAETSHEETDSHNRHNGNQHSTTTPPCHHQRIQTVSSSHGQHTRIIRQVTVEVEGTGTTLAVKTRDKISLHQNDHMSFWRCCVFC